MHVHTCACANFSTWCENAKISKNVRRNRQAANKPITPTMTNQGFRGLRRSQSVGGGLTKHGQSQLMHLLQAYMFRGSLSVKWLY